MIARAVAVAVVASASALGCLGPSEFRCDDHAACGAGATCELDGRCSAPDPLCPSRRRYAARAGDLSGACVGPSCADDPATAIAAGAAHACLLRASGGVWCWGRNDRGQLGDGTHTPRGSAARVAGLDDARAVAAGADHTCAVRAGGGVVCWGAGAAGQLGDGGAGGDRPAPIVVAGVTGAAAIAAGDDFSCAALADGTARCWGDDSLGQLGDDGAAAATRLPSPVFALDGVTALAAGGRHACAVTDDERVFCWGANDRGQSGVGAAAFQPRPVRLAPLDGVLAVAVGPDHACAATRAAGLLCWGDNATGALGVPSAGVVTTPAAVPIVTDPLAIAAGAGHTCAVRLDGDLYCWGANDRGQAAGDDDALPLPLQVRGLAAGRALAAGDAFTCALLGDGAVSCWGDDRFGQLGSSAPFRARPAPVPGIPFVRSAAGGARHTCALAAAASASGLNEVLCWGANDRGQLGDNRAEDRSTPAPTIVTGLFATAIAAGAATSCALLTSDKLACWGELNGMSYPVEVRLAPNTALDGSHAVEAPALAAGARHGCALGRTASTGPANVALCFGDNGEGQLGDGTQVSRLQPEAALLDAAAPPGPPVVLPVLAVTAGGAHSCALDGDGGVWCWGRGAEGQLGDGATTSRPSPVAVILDGAAGGTAGRASAVAAGGAHTCAVVDDDQSAGPIVCWGANDQGQLGDGTRTNAATPVAVTPASRARAVAAGDAHACALLTDATVVCWGANDQGQLGDGTTTAASSPVAVTGLTGVAAISAGGTHTCAARTDGTLACWGADTSGQLGLGRPLATSTPTLARLACR